jgi:hypothetical protein
MSSKIEVEIDWEPANESPLRLRARSMTVTWREADTSIGRHVAGVLARELDLCKLGSSGFDRERGHQEWRR